MPDRRVGRFGRIGLLLVILVVAAVLFVVWQRQVTPVESIALPAQRETPRAGVVVSINGDEIVIVDPATGSRSPVRVSDSTTFRLLRRDGQYTPTTVESIAVGEYLIVRIDADTELHAVFAIDVLPRDNR